MPSFRSFGLLSFLAASAAAQTLTINPTSFILNSTLGTTTSDKITYAGPAGLPVSVSVTLLRAASAQWLTISGATTGLPSTGSVTFMVHGDRIPPSANTGPNTENNGDYMALVQLRSGTRTTQATVLVRRLPNSTLLASESNLDFTSAADVKPQSVSILAAQVDPDGPAPTRLNCVASPQDGSDGSWVTVDAPVSVTTANGIRTADFNIRINAQAQSLSAGLHSSYVAFQNRDKLSDIIYVIVNIQIAAAPTVAVSGAIRDAQNQPVAGVSIDFANVGTVATDATGRYTASLPRGYTGTATPALSGYTFSPARRNYSNLTAAANSDDYAATKLPTTVTISGSVTNSAGQPISGVTLSTGTVSTVTGATGTYTLQVPIGFSGIVTPALGNFGFNPARRIYANVPVNIAGENYVGTPPPVSIGGTILTQQGQPLGGVAIVFNNQGPATVTSSNGSYSISVPATYTGAATPTLTGYTFTPPSRAYTSVSVNLLSENYTAIPVGQTGGTTFTISGRVTTAQGDALAGVTISFGTGQNAITDASGAYSGKVPASYSGTVTPTRSGFTFQPVSRAFTNVTADQAGANFTGIPQASNAPVITQVQNAAGFQPVIQQQSWAAITGSNLAPSTREWAGSDFVGGKTPTSLDGVSVSVNGRPAAISYISPTQINVWTPADAATGTVMVTVTSQGVTSSPFSAQMQSFSPAFFLWTQRYAVATDGSTFLGPPGILGAGATTVPAKPGQIVSLWGTGFGPVDPTPPADAAVPRSPLFVLRTAPVIRVGGQTADYLAGALAADSVGLYVINVRLPANLPDGDQKVEISINGVLGPDGVFVNIRR